MQTLYCLTPPSQERNCRSHSHFFTCVQCKNFLESIIHLCIKHLMLSIEGFSIWNFVTLKLTGVGGLHPNQNLIIMNTIWYSNISILKHIFCFTLCFVWQICVLEFFSWFIDIYTLRVHYAHAEVNLNSGYSKYVRVAHVHYFLYNYCTLNTSCPHELSV